MMMIRSILAVGVLLVCPGGASGQGTIPDYDFEWVTIGDVGNVAYDGGFTGHFAGRGGVDHEYRLSRTEITTSQWFEFVQAYALYVSPTEQESISFTGWFIQSVIGPGGGYEINAGTANLPTNMSWRMAARYANWLHNNKANTPEAFENGAYDTSTFTQNPDGTYNDQTTHSPSARFWIPSLDEWMKAAYFDPNRYGFGQGGWWQFPAMTDSILTVGAPGFGQTNAGAWQNNFPPWKMNVGHYADVMSAYQCLDMSGGMAELTEEWNGSGFARLAKGSSFFSPFTGATMYDSISFWGLESPGISVDSGLRIASEIPIPACVADIVPAGGNGAVNIDDLIAVLNAFGSCPASPTVCDADITPPGGNGTVNIDDLVALLNSFGPCP